MIGIHRGVKEGWATDTDEYWSGNAGLAAQLGCVNILRWEQHWVKYFLPPEHGDSWLVDIQAAKGLFVTSAYFTLLEPVAREYRIQQTGLWICSLERGEITVIEQGKKAWILTEGVHVLVNRGRPFKLIFSNAEPLCYTSVLAFEDLIAGWLKDRPQGFGIIAPESALQENEYRVFRQQTFSLRDALRWLPPHYNMPEVILLMDQIKLETRARRLPLLYFECKVIELLALIMRNVQDEWHWKIMKQDRSSYLNYQNRQYVVRVKEELDRNFITPLHIKQLAALAEMGTTKLRQCFKLYYQVTISEYIQQARMKHALRMLSDDALSIQNIAERVGYQNASKFTAVFKQVNGCTPRQFRQAMRL